MSIFHGLDSFNSNQYKKYESAGTKKTAENQSRESRKVQRWDVGSGKNNKKVEKVVKVEKGNTKKLKDSSSVSSANSVPSVLQKLRSGLSTFIKSKLARKGQHKSENKSVKAYGKKVRKFNKIRIIKTVIFFSLISAFLLWLFWGVPSPTRLSSEIVPVSTKLFDRNGKLLYEIYADKRSTPVNLDEIPKYVWQSTLAIEDKDFYKHYGVSISGISRALYNTLFQQKLQGGSTLTQQLVKNTLLTPERTLRRKVRELALTLLVETIYSKDQILVMYLNQIPYGGTAYGIGAASEIYFSKEAKDLSLSEATLLAGLPQRPSVYSPFGSKPELAKERQKTVLRRMVEDGYISKEEADAALDEKLDYSDTQHLKAPHFSLWVKELLAEKYGEVMVEKGGLRVTTTLDLSLQEFAEDAVATEVVKLKDYEVGNGAALVTRPKTGEVLAMVGSKGYFAEDEDGKVNIIFAKRQPGSSIKPLNYALGLKDKKITAATPLADVPTCFLVAGSGSYCPKNYDGGFHGATQVRYSLANSYNIPAVRVLALNGLENFIDFSKKMGITTFEDPKNYGLSLTLGGGEVKPFDMATAFGVLANQGIRQDLMAILKVEDWKGNVLEENNPDEVELSGPRVLEPEVTFIISHILSDNGARSAAFGASSQLNVRGHPEVSVKTGTTNDRRDNWTIGYTPLAFVLAWVGNNDNSPMSRATSGVSGASPIWNDIIKEALDKAEEGRYGENEKGHAKLLQPNGVIGANICSTSGNLPQNPDSPECPIRYEYFLKGKVGAGIESGQKDVEVFNDTGQLANDKALPEQKHTQNHPFLLDPLGTLICLDCPIASSSAQLSYP